MREVDITEYCLDFIDKQRKRVSDKFFQLILIMEEIKVVHSNFVKKLQNSKFYKLRIKAGNEYRVLVFAIAHLNFSEFTKSPRMGLSKKSYKDYLKAIKEAERILGEYLKNAEL